MSFKSGSTSSNHLTFEEHMQTRVTLFDGCVKTTIGKDFAVFEFGDKEELEKAVKFAEACNRIYNYTLDSNKTDKLVCLDV